MGSGGHRDNKSGPEGGHGPPQKGGLGNTGLQISTLSRIVSVILQY